MTAKWSVTTIITEHARTLVDQRTGKAMISDYLVFYGLPIAAGIACYLGGFRLRGTEGLLAGISILTALLFGLLIHGFTLGMRVSDDSRIAKRGRIAKLIDELQANLTYAVLIGISTTLVLILAVGTTQPGHALGVLISSIIVLLTSHLLLVILMALRRLQSAYGLFRS